ncbi:MAG: hypothetical protein WC438_05790 [Candidatus Pacearchaeota archaeon]|jgi:hypothetical protein
MNSFYINWRNEKDIKELIGKIITSIEITYKSIIFTMLNKEKYIMCHDQDCCELVEIEDIIGDVSDLLNTPILSFTEDTSITNPENIIKRLLF